MAVGLEFRRSFFLRLKSNNHRVLARHTTDHDVRKRTAGKYELTKHLCGEASWKNEALCSPATMNRNGFEGSSCRRRVSTVATNNIVQITTITGRVG